MKLTLRLVASFMLVVIAVTILYGLLDVLSETRRFQKDTDEIARQVHETLHQRLEAAWKQEGRAGVVDVIQKRKTLQRQVRVRWVVFDASSGSSDCPIVPPPQLTSGVIDRHELIEAQDAEGRSFLHSYWSIPVRPSPGGGLEISRSMDDLDQKRQRIHVRTITQVFLTLLLLGLAAALIGVRRVGRPLQQLIDKTRRIGAGDLSGPVRVFSRDELGELATSINQMCTNLLDAQRRIEEETESRISAVEALRHADRLRTVGRLAAGIAHQLGTPLNVVSGQAEMIAAGELSEAEVQSGAKVIYSETERMASSIRQLLDFARPSVPQRTDADVTEVVRTTVSLLTPVATKSRVKLSLELPEGPLRACFDVGQIQQVAANLIVNAIQAMPEGGTLEIEVSEKETAAPSDTTPHSRPLICLRFVDNGPGIAEQDLDQVFEPFFTTKDVGEGTGLGLSIAYGMVREHGGWIAVTSQLERGTCFTVYLPKESDS